MSNTKSRSTLASFLGDPVFPEVAIQSSRGAKILLYQDLYTQYSRRAFTHIEDRPIAIAGLEKRLIHSFNTWGGFGVFDDGRLGLLRRCLLWCRGADETSLERIQFDGTHGIRQMAVPTWSWMGYKGGIDYLDLPFNGVEWDEKALRSPWTLGVGMWHTDSQPGFVELSALVRDFDVQAAAGLGFKIIYDVPAKRDGPRPGLKCVILGRLQSPNLAVADRTHYVLWVALSATQASGLEQIYERVGVGYMPGSAIRLDQPGEAVKIR